MSEIESLILSGEPVAEILKRIKADEEETVLEQLVLIGSRPELVEALLERGVNPNSGRAFLYCLLRQEHSLRMLSAFLKHGANPNVVSARYLNGYRALAYLAFYDTQKPNPKGELLLLAGAYPVTKEEKVGKMCLGWYDNCIQRIGACWLATRACERALKKQGKIHKDTIDIVARHLWSRRLDPMWNKKK